MGSAIRLGLVGIGKIVRDQHLPTLLEQESFVLAAAASRHNRLEGVRTYSDIEMMIRETPTLDAVSVCTPPSGRYAIARAALAAGLHLMLEKPPGATVGEVLDLAERAQAADLTLFASWHSREAAAVESAGAWLARRTLKSVNVVWKEDIRVWHPGQEWLLEPGGLGVFDPGINALSILTRILPERLILEHATLDVPANRSAPIAAEVRFGHGGTSPISGVFDFREAGPPRWDIEIETEEGNLRLTEGGRRMFVDGVERVSGPDSEYWRLYSRFAGLIETGMSDVDVSPLQHVADIFQVGRRNESAAFHF